jgi:predicted Zn-dependent protease
VERRILRKMKKHVLTLFIAGALLLVQACATVPVTERQQINLIPSSSILSMSFKQYNQFLEQADLSDDEEAVRTVKRVGHRIADAVERYFGRRDEGERLKEYDWEFHLVDDDQVNAWAMPGGKVVVYSGILPVAESEAGLAVIMGHEVAHAIARHGNERMSQALLAQFGSLALSQAMQDQPAQTQQLWMMAYGFGAQVGLLLPYSRLHEREADHLGLIFMAMAGYDPRVAVDFWQRMAEKKGGKAPPEFLSTHPADDTRIANIKEVLPEAMKYYRRSE